MFQYHGQWWILIGINLLFSSIIGYVIEDTTRPGIIFLIITAFYIFLCYILEKNLIIFYCRILIKKLWKVKESCITIQPVIGTVLFKNLSTWYHLIIAFIQIFTKIRFDPFKIKFEFIYSII